jgi:HPr kinase/phosphorylase
LQVTVQSFFEHVKGPLSLTLHAGQKGLNRVLKSARIQKPALALVGYSAFVHRDRVQILGQTELSFLATLTADQQERAVSALTALELACILITKGLPLPEVLVRRCEESGTPLLRTPMTSSECIRKVLAYLDDLLSPRCRTHGVLMDIAGVGVLIVGASGIGKSECAIDLVERGHRLVADDVVEIRRRGEDLVGQAAKIIQDLIEIRGLGILNVSELYGIAATRDHKRIELCIELEEWSQESRYDRVGLEERTVDILGVAVTSLIIPVRPGRSIAGIVEIAARNHLLRLRGHHAARDLNLRIHQEVHAVSKAPHKMDGPPPDLTTGDVPNLGAAAELAEVTDHIEDEVE